MSRPTLLSGLLLPSLVRCAAALALVLGGCAAIAPPDSDTQNTAAADAKPEVWDNAWSRSSVAKAGTAGWHHQILPGKAPSRYSYERKDGRDAVAAQSDSAASLLRKDVHIPPGELDRIRFSWKVPELIAGADLALRDKADSPVRVALAFEGDRSKFSARNSVLSELMRLVTGEPMPYATLIYVWCNTRAPGSVIHSPRTDRIRKLVVESGSQRLNQWLDYERNIRVDFEKAFGEAPGALVGVAIMTDTDNTHSKASAWYGKVTLAGH